MAKKGGLGKGLDALIPGGYEPEGETNLAQTVPIEQIRPNPHQPRQTMDEVGLHELAESIREHGVIQPLIVSFDNQNEIYMLIAGERRWRAAQLAGLETVPVVFRQVNDQQRLEIALIENVQRADLTPLETAEAYRQLSDDFRLSHEEIAIRVGKSRVSVTNTLRLLKLPEVIRQALAEGKITEGHARAMLGVDSPTVQLAALQLILQKGLNVRQTEELIRKLSQEKSTRLKNKPAPPEILSLEEQLRSRLGTRVNLRHGKKGGTLVIHYYSDEELNSLISQILKE